jgi:hypothetical protein
VYQYFFRIDTLELMEIVVPEVAEAQGGLEAYPAGAELTEAAAGCLAVTHRRLQAIAQHWTLRQNQQLEGKRQSITPSCSGWLRAHSLHRQKCCGWPPECGRWQVGICGLFCLGQGSSRKKANKRLYRVPIRATCERSFANGGGKWAIQFPAPNLASGS